MFSTPGILLISFLLSVYFLIALVSKGNCLSILCALLPFFTAFIAFPVVPQPAWLSSVPEYYNFKYELLSENVRSKIYLQEAVEAHKIDIEASTFSTLLVHRYCQPYMLEDTRIKPLSFRLAA
jgi:hypothetical protein